jgi:hypothetical protein
MLDLATEKAITLDEATRLIPAARGGKRTHISTILRWILGGAKAPTEPRSTWTPSACPVAGSRPAKPSRGS